MKTRNKTAMVGLGFFFCATFAHGGAMQHRAQLGYVSRGRYLGRGGDQSRSLQVQMRS